MDTLGLAAVITTGALGFAGLGASIWSTNHAGRVAMQGRVDERRIDACVEILRLVEHQSLWFERRLARAELMGDPFEKAPELPRAPEVHEQAIIETLLVAFGSAALRTACLSWTEAAAQLEQQFEVAAWNWEQDYHGPETPTSPADLAELKQKLDNLNRERRTVEVAIAQEVKAIQGKA